MRTLIVDDDFVSRKVLNGILRPFGEVHVAVNGKEAVYAFKSSIEENEPYDLICLDIMMPELDGRAVLREIRSMEEPLLAAGGSRVRIIMVSALAGRYEEMKEGGLSDAYIVKPISKKVLEGHLQRLGLAKQP